MKAAAPIIRDVLNIAATNGLDVQREFGLTMNTDLTAKLNQIDQPATRSAEKSRIAVFDAIVPTPDQDAGSARMFMILKSLAKIGKTIFVPVFGPPGGPYASLLEKEGIEVASRLDLKRLIGGSDCEIAVLSRVAVADEMLSAIRRENKTIKVIFDTVDVYSMRLESEYRITGNRDAADEAELRRKQERSLARLSDQIWCVTEYDEQVLKQDAPQADIKIIPTIHELKDRGASFAEREGLLFIGSFLHRPNRDAMDYFVKKISPLLSRSLPGVKLQVVGSNMTDELRTYASDSVIMLGHVPRVDELFQRSRLFVAPLRFGSGMNGKIGQALSYGLPVITTTIGAEGFHLRDGHEAMIADDPEAFAEAIVETYQDEKLWQHLSQTGYEHVRDHFTPAVVNEKIVTAIKELGYVVSSNGRR